MNFEVRYSRANRLLHRLAFASGGLQVALADIEGQIFRKHLAACSASRPVFVTALPRAGTTIILNLLFDSGEFASHTYRDMPFVLCPLLWQALVRPFQKDEEARERAHGDGLAVSSDSPEAFEEILWHQFWPDHYHEWRIDVWKTAQNPEFIEFFREHMRRIVFLRRNDSRPCSRYLSKNNLNIARIPTIVDAFPDARVVVPFRDPVQHAASLLQQHLRFLEAHREDPFARDYMAGIGHFDFGANLKPVDFDGWLGRDRRPEARMLGFWVEYWLSAHTALLAGRNERVLFVANEDLVAEPATELRRIADFLELKAPDALVSRASAIRAPRHHEIDPVQADKDLISAARSVYASLRKE